MSKDEDEERIVILNLVLKIMRMKLVLPKYQSAFKNTYVIRYD